MHTTRSLSQTAARSTHWGMIGVAMLSLLFLAACSGDDPTAPGGGGTGGPPGELTAVLNSGGEFQDVVPSHTESPPEEFTSGSGVDQYFCTRHTVDLIEGYSDYPQFDPNSQIIFPGNLLQGSTLDHATPTSIPVARGNGRIVITLVNGASSASRQLDVVSLGSVYDAMNQIIAANPGDLPARTTYTMQRISSREQLGVAIRANYNNLTTDIQGSFRYASDVAYNRFLVKLTQSYYTIAFEQPTDPASFFAPSVTAVQLSQYVGPGNPAAYVSSVTYGRIFYLLIQSTDSVQEIEASIDASFSGAIASGGIGADVKYISELSSVEVGGYAIGGRADLAGSALMGNFADLELFIRLGGTITTGQPLSYTVNAAAHPEKQLKVKVATSYDVVDCTPIGQSLKRGIAWYRADHGVSTVSYSGARGATRWADLLGHADRDAAPAFGGPQVAGLYLTGQLNGQPIVSFQYDATYSTGSMRISGTPMRDTDYTIFAVVKRLDQPGNNLEMYWLWGDGDVQNQVLRIGFPNDNTVSVSHGGSATLTAMTVRPVYDQYQVFTFRFSQTDGLTIYINGLQRAHDASITAPLEVFTGASIGIGAKNGWPIDNISLQMADLQIYGIATTDAQRRYVETQLLERYGI
jgi:hypothetical protein